MPTNKYTVTFFDATTHKAVRETVFTDYIKALVSARKAKLAIAVIYDHNLNTYRDIRGGDGLDVQLAARGYVR